MASFLAGFELEWTQETHHGREACLALVRILDDHVAATEREQPLELSAVRTGHFVKEIPGGHAERFALVELLVQIRRLEARQVEQASVDHSERIRHRTARTLTDLDSGDRLRLPLRCGLDDRRQRRARIRHMQRNDSIQTDGPIVRLCVWLNERDADVYVGR